METARESARRIVSSKAFIFLVAVLLVLSMIGLTVGTGGPGDEVTLKAVASSNVPTSRTGEEVFFSSEGSRGNIEIFYWEFGDGATANGSEVSHAFEDGGWHNVTMTVINAKGRTANATVTVGVQPEDVHNTRDLPRDRDVRPMWMHGFGLLGTVGPHIAPPTSNLEYHVERAFGTFQIYVEVWIYSGNIYTVERLYEVERTMTGGNLDITYTVEPEDLSELTATNGSSVHISSMIDQGRWASAHISVDVEFPDLITEISG